jgi:hypothetical protein
MSSYQEVKKSVGVPKGTGIRGFLAAIEEILKLPRLQNIEVNAKGVVTYRHFVREGEAEKPLDIDFDSLTPYAAIRNNELTELTDLPENPAEALGCMLDHAAADHMHPVAFVGGANTSFWSWYKRSTGQAFTSRETLFGLPFLTDRHIDDAALVLCSAFGQTTALIDTVRSYKLSIPPAPAPKVTP